MNTKRTVYFVYPANVGNYTKRIIIPNNLIKYCKWNKDSVILLKNIKNKKTYIRNLHNTDGIKDITKCIYIPSEMVHDLKLKHNNTDLLKIELTDNNTLEISNQSKTLNQVNLILKARLFGTSGLIVTIPRDISIAMCIVKKDIIIKSKDNVVMYKSNYRFRNGNSVEVILNKELREYFNINRNDDMVLNIDNINDIITISKP